MKKHYRHRSRPPKKEGTDAARQLRLLDALRQRPEGLTRTEVNAVVFNHVLGKTELDRLTDLLFRAELIEIVVTIRPLVRRLKTIVYKPTPKALIDPRD